MLMTSMLARMPDLRHQVQSEHVSDSRGHCQECGPTTHWPCEVYEIAAEAERLSEPAARLPRPRRPSRA
ncbi:MAG TPA: hypothetical protein VGH89_13230 [Pseudonocardia sp.]|jgi:hypothetical protein